jgi:hypothetical protein
VPGPGRKTWQELPDGKRIGRVERESLNLSSYVFTSL